MEPHTAKTSSMQEFEKALRNMIQDPANRMSVATLKLKEAKQSEGQSVRLFANQLEELEEDIPEISYEEQRAWTLLHGLRPEVRSSVLREERGIRSREQVIAAAQRIDELGGVAGVSHTIRKGNSRFSEPKALEGQMDSKKCYQCGLPCHIARICPGNGGEKSSSQ